MFHEKWNELFYGSQIKLKLLILVHFKLASKRLTRFSLSDNDNWNQGLEITDDFLSINFGKSITSFLQELQKPLEM